MDIRSFLSVFHSEYEAFFDEPFNGDNDLLVEAFNLLEGDFEIQALESAFMEAHVEGCETWGEDLFWEQLSIALKEADL